MGLVGAGKALFNRALSIATGAAVAFMKSASVRL